MFFRTQVILMHSTYSSKAGMAMLSGITRCFFKASTISSCNISIRENTFQGTKIFQYCTCPAGRVTYNFHSSCKHMHLSFKNVCNKEHKGVICNTTSLSYFSQDECFGKNYSSFLDFTRNYRRTKSFCPLLFVS